MTYSRKGNVDNDLDSRNRGADELVYMFDRGLRAVSPIKQISTARLR